MTLAELQALIMRQAVAKLERLQGELATREAAPPAPLEPDKPARRPIALDYLREEIAEQEILIAKLTYQHEREESDLVRVERMQALEMSERLARIDEIEHLIDHRNGVLAAFKDSNEIQQAGHVVQEIGLDAIAEAIKGRAGGVS